MNATADHAMKRAQRNLDSITRRIAALTVDTELADRPRRKLETLEAAAKHWRTDLAAQQLLRA